MSYPYKKDVSKKKMGRYQKIVIAIAIVLGCFCTVLMLNSSAVQMSLNNPTTEEDYVLLEENAMEVARTLDRNVLSDETLSVDFSFNETRLIVEVKSIKAKIIAKIPVLQKQFSIKDEVIEYSANLDFENVEYERENLLYPAIYYLYLSVTYGFVLGFMIWSVLYYFWKDFKKKQDEIKDDEISLKRG